MDNKNVQRNERAHRKLVRSSEQSWFGDNVADSGNVPSGGGKAENKAETPAFHHHRSGSIGHDNKTIRRLEFFTSLQKQLMSSIGRRTTTTTTTTSTGAASSSSACNVKRNASCRHHKTTMRDKSDNKQMPSSYSSASLACCNNSTTSPVEHELIQRLELDQRSNNTIGNHLSPTASIASAIIPTTTELPICPVSHEPSNPIPIIADTKNDASLSKSMPNTLMLSPTNPFFSSLEQHFIDQQQEEQQEEPHIDKQVDNNRSTVDDDHKHNKNPFLYEINNGITTTTTTTMTESCDNNTSTNNNFNSDNNNKITNTTNNNTDNKNSFPFPTGPCTKREEFLRATMKICLVVSPPSNKFQVC